MPKSIHDYARDKRAAAITLHWHLCRAANMVASGLDLGASFEVEISSAEVARKAWHEAQDAIMRAEPDHGG